MIQFDATDGNIGIGHGFGTAVLVHSTRDPVVGAPTTSLEFFLDPLSWRFHDTMGRLPSGVADRRVNVQTILDYHAPHSVPATTDESPYAYDPCTPANRGTRYVDPDGYAAMPTSLMRVIDSADGRHVVALVSQSLGTGQGTKGTQEKQGKDEPREEGYLWSTLGVCGTLGSVFEPGLYNIGPLPVGNAGTPVGPLVVRWDAPFGMPSSDDIAQPNWIGPLDLRGGVEVPTFTKEELLQIARDAATGVISDAQKAALDRVVGPNSLVGGVPSGKSMKDSTEEEGEWLKGVLVFDESLSTLDSGGRANGKWRPALKIPKPKEPPPVAPQKPIKGPPGKDGPQGPAGKNGGNGKDGKDGAGQGRDDGDSGGVACPNVPFVGLGGGGIATPGFNPENPPPPTSGPIPSPGGGTFVPDPAGGWVFHPPAELPPSTTGAEGGTGLFTPEGQPGAFVPPLQGGDQTVPFPPSTTPDGNGFGWAPLVPLPGGGVSFGPGGPKINPLPPSRINTGFGRGFGDTIASAPIGYLGGPGGAQNLGDQITLLTGALQATRELVNSLMGGPDYFAGNLVAVNRNPGGLAPVGHTLGQWVESNGQDVLVGANSSPLAVVSIYDSSRGGTVGYADDRPYDQRVNDARDGSQYTTGVFTVAREVRGEGVTDDRGLLHLDNDRTQTGLVTGKLVDTTDGAFRVNLEGVGTFQGADGEGTTVGTDVDVAGGVTVGEDVAVTGGITQQGGETVVSVPEGGTVGYVPIDDGAGGYAWGPQSGGGGSVGDPLVFGDGRDGPLVLGGNLSLSAPLQCTTITLNGYKLHTNGWLVQCDTLDASVAGSQVHNGGADALPGNAGGGSGTIGPVAIEVGGGGNGGRGASYGTIGGQSSTAGSFAGAGTYGGGTGGAGGTGGGGNAGSGATAASDFVANPKDTHDWLHGVVFGAGSPGGYYSIYGGSGGGGGGCGTPPYVGQTNYGGDGGAAGGTCIIAAQTIIGEPGTATVASVGGNGGQAVSVSGGAGDYADGGGGGGGGVAICIYETATDLSFDCSGGTGGNAVGGGNNGSNGTAGTGYAVDLTAGTVTRS